MVRKATFVVPAVRGSLLGGGAGGAQGGMQVGTGRGLGQRGRSFGSGLQIRPVGLAEVTARPPALGRARDRREENVLKRGRRMLGSAGSDSTGGSDIGGDSMRDLEDFGITSPPMQQPPMQWDAQGQYVHHAPGGQGIMMQPGYGQGQGYGDGAGQGYD